MYITVITTRVTARKFETLHALIYLLFLLTYDSVYKLIKYMPNPREFRHLKQDPDNEPDFYLIQLIAPLPDDERFGKDLTIDEVLNFCKEHGRSQERVLQQLYALQLVSG